MKNVLITGAKSFIGINFIKYLTENFDDIDILSIDTATSSETLYDYASRANFVFHLEEIMYSENDLDYERINYNFTSDLIQALRISKSKAPIVLLSSNQALSRNSYGFSKFAAEQLLLDYYQASQIPVCIYRMPLVFGKGEHPGKNTVIAKYCYNIAHNIPIEDVKYDETFKFVYIADIIEEFMRALHGIPNLVADSRFALSPWSYTITRGELIKKINSFAKSRETRFMPSLAGRFDKQLYSTYLTYIDMESLKSPLEREEYNDRIKYQFMNSQEQGQFSIMRLEKSKSWARHWHEKNAHKILVVAGKAIIRLENKSKGEIVEFCVNGDEPSVIDIPPDYIHDIKNIGDSDVTMLTWASSEVLEVRPDIFILKDLEKIL